MLERSLTPVRAPRQRWWLLGLFMLGLIALMAGGPDLVLLMRYDRQAIGEGQWWRLLTAHLAHGNVRHLLLNLAGLGVIASLLRSTYRAGEWFVLGTVSAVAVSAGLWVFEGEVGWYVGLSGVLHGLLAAGGLFLLGDPSRRVVGAALLGLLVVKLTWEQAQGAIHWSGSLPVIVDAHLYGAVGGLLAALAVPLAARWSSFR